MRPLSVSIRKASPCSPQNVERSQTALSTTQVIFILQPFSRAGRARLDIQNGGNGLGRRRSNGPVFHCARPSSALVPGCRYLKQLRSSLFLLLKGMLFYMLIVTSEEMVHHPASLLQVLDPMPEYLIPQGGQAVDAPRRSLCLFPVPRGDHPALLLHLPQRSVDNGGVKGFKAEVPAAPRAYIRGRDHDAGARAAQVPETAPPGGSTLAISICVCRETCSPPFLLHFTILLAIVNML